MTTRERHIETWGAHMGCEFGMRDAAAAVETMTADASVTLIPTGRRAVGRDAILAFYRDEFIPSIPKDIQMVPIHRTASDDSLVDELRVTVEHRQRMDWFLPGVEPTGRKLEFDLVVVVGFRDGKVAFERLYWDALSVMRQAGALA